MTLLDQLRQRKLVQWTLGYLAGGWVLLQVMDLLADNFDWSRTVMQVATVLVAVGGVAVMILAWYHGDRGRQRMSAFEAVLLVGVTVLAGVLVARVARGARDAPAAGQPEAASVAVLPFVNMSADADQEYFGDGITEEILNVLARIPGLRVSARTSSFAFKNKELPIGEIARQLNVAHVLEGSVRKSGEQVRITAQLIDARSDRHLWSESFDRRVTDVFAVQDEIARAVATALQLQLRTADQRGRTLRTESALAHEHYLRGLYLWHRRHQDVLAQAVSHLQAAVQEDPNFAPAHAGLALTYAILPQYVRAHQLDPAPTAAAGKVAARRALELDPLSAQAHAALGQIAQEFDWDWTAAEQHYLEAQRLDPNYATAHQWRAEVLSVVGRYDEAVREIETALTLDPLSSIIRSGRAFIWFEQGRVDDARREYEALVREDPRLDVARFNLFLLYAETGAYDKALALIDNEASARAIMEGMQGDAAARAGALAMLGQPRVREAIGSYNGLANIYMMMGAADSALALLHRGADTREPSIAYAAHARLFRPLHDRPAFQEFRRKLRLPAS